MPVTQGPGKPIRRTQQSGTPSNGTNGPVNQTPQWPRAKEQRRQMHTNAPDPVAQYTRARRPNQSSQSWAPSHGTNGPVNKNQPDPELMSKNGKCTQNHRGPVAQYTRTRKNGYSETNAAGILLCSRSRRSNKPTYGVSSKQASPVHGIADPTHKHMNVQGNPHHSAPNELVEPASKYCGRQPQHRFAQIWDIHSPNQRRRPSSQAAQVEPRNCIIARRQCVLLNSPISNAIAAA